MIIPDNFIYFYLCSILVLPIGIYLESIIFEKQNDK